jgi:hypothetical protein
MRIIIRGTIARRSTDDVAVEALLFGLPLRETANYAAWTAANNLPRTPATFHEWQSQRLPARAVRSLAGVIA